MNDIDIELLKGIANQLRIHSIAATTAAGSGHPTSCCSAADVVAALFFGHTRYDPKNPQFHVAFEKDVFLLKKTKAESLKKPTPEPEPQPKPEPEAGPQPQPEPEPEAVAKTKTIRLTGNIPPEIWNRLGTKIIPKLRSGKELNIEVRFSTTVDLTLGKSLESALRQLLQDFGIADKFRIE